LLQAVLFPDTDTAVPVTVTIGTEPVLKTVGVEIGVSVEVEDDDVMALDGEEVDMAVEGENDVALGDGEIVLLAGTLKIPFSAVLVVLRLPTAVEIVPEGV